MEKLIVSNTQLPEIRDALIKGIEISSGAKSSATHYHSRQDQINAVKQAVQNIYSTSKELPLLLAYQNGATGFFIQEVILNELKGTSKGGSLNIINPTEWYDNNFSNTLLSGIVENLDQNNGITYLLRLYQSVKAEKINNRRTRRIFFNYLYNHSNLEFVSIKYRNKIKEILTHLYGVKTVSSLLRIANTINSDTMMLTGDDAKIVHDNIDKYLNGGNSSIKILNTLKFVFKKADSNTFGSDYPLYSQYFAAKEDIFSANNIPEEILLGLISSKNHPQYSDHWSAKEQRELTMKKIRESNKSTTANQAMRQTKKNKALNVEKEVDVTKVTDFLALYKTGYEDSFTDELNEAIDALAEKRKINDFYYNNIGVIVDESESMTGHSKESKNTPKAIASFTSKVLEKSATSAKVVSAKGVNTDLASSFINLIEENDQYDAIFILTDGYENSYDGLTGEVIDKWKELTGNETPIYQLSPITGAEMKAKVRNISDKVSTIAVTKPESVQLQMTAKLLEQDTKKWLELQVESIAEQN
jgi:hypothetical protein